MRLPREPGFPVIPPTRPTRDLLLAQALDACIAAERRLPGSAQEIIARQPAWARGQLQRLLGLAGSLDAAASNAVMSSEFRVAARARLMQRVGGDVAPVPVEADPQPALVRSDTPRMSLLQARQDAQPAVRKTFWQRVLEWSVRLRPSPRH